VDRSIPTPDEITSALAALKARLSAMEPSPLTEEETVAFDESLAAIRENLRQLKASTKAIRPL
jgi:hypothetical protein